MSVDTSERDDPVIVVSGLPRSGTSMTMQMLAAGNVPLFIDGSRQRDDDNPRGYYEHEAIARLKKDNSWVGNASGKAMKVIAQLLPHLPADLLYKVVFLNRSIDEVVRSQRTMLSRNGKEGARLDDHTLKKVFVTQLERIQEWLANQPNFMVLQLEYYEVVANPFAAAKSLVHFLDEQLPVEEMAAAVDPSLYRQRAT